MIKHRIILSPNCNLLTSDLSCVEMVVSRNWLTDHPRTILSILYHNIISSVEQTNDKTRNIPVNEERNPDFIYTFRFSDLGLRPHIRDGGKPHISQKMEMSQKVADCLTKRHQNEGKNRAD